jgi:hypothetical protein
VIAGDHEWPHPGRAAGGNGFRNLGARRVGQPDQADEGQSALRGLSRERPLGRHLLGAGDHAQPVGGHTGRRGQDLRSFLRRDGGVPMPGLRRRLLRVFMRLLLST